MSVKDNSGAMNEKSHLTPKTVLKDTKRFIELNDRLKIMDVMNLKRHLTLSTVLKDTEKPIFSQTQFKCNE